MKNKNDLYQYILNTRKELLTKGLVEKIEITKDELIIIKELIRVFYKTLERKNINLYNYTQQKSLEELFNENMPFSFETVETILNRAYLAKQKEATLSYWDPKPSKYYELITEIIKLIDLGYVCPTKEIKEIKKTNTSSQKRERHLLPKDIYPPKEEWEKFGFEFEKLDQINREYYQKLYCVTLPPGWTYNTISEIWDDDYFIYDENGIKRARKYYNSDFDKYELYMFPRYQGYTNEKDCYINENGDLVCIEEAYFGNDLEKIIVLEDEYTVDKEGNAHFKYGINLEDFTMKFGSLLYPEYVDDLTLYWPDKQIESEKTLTKTK